MESVGMDLRLELLKRAALPSLVLLYSCNQKTLAESRKFKTSSLWTAKFTRRQVTPVQYKFAPLSNQRSIKILAFSDDKDDWSSVDDYKWDPVYEIEVPSDQHPTLIGAGALFGHSNCSFNGTIASPGHGYCYITSSRNRPEVIEVDNKTVLRGVDILNPPPEAIKDDDIAAASAAAAANGRPAYCSNRYNQALTDGQYCE